MKKMNDGSTYIENLDGNEELAKAIVLQAAMDYKSALLWLRWNPRDYEWKKEKKDIVAFFHSEWYKTLTEIEPERIMDEMERQAEKEWSGFCEKMKAQTQNRQKGKAKNQATQE